jgi:hypothetical protein
MPQPTHEPSLEVIASRTRFEEIRAPWKALATSNVFLTWDWLDFWWQQFNARRQLRKARRRLEREARSSCAPSSSSTRAPRSRSYWMSASGSKPSGWKGTAGSALASDPRLVALWKTLLGDSIGRTASGSRNYDWTGPSSPSASTCSTTTASTR